MTYAVGETGRVGVSGWALVSADLLLSGSDTYSTHDVDHGRLLGDLAGGMDYLWEYADV